MSESSSKQEIEVEINSVQSLQALTADLSNLDQAPFYRGNVESLEDGIITGWALSTYNPIRPVYLELWLRDQLVASTSTDIFRADVSSVVGLPLKAGFRFDLTRIKESSASEIMRQLLATEDEFLDTGALVSVKIGQEDFVLPTSDEISSGSIAVSEFLGLLRASSNSASTNERTELRQHLLSIQPPADERNDDDVRVIAYYLPQFHPFAENDEWWGTGFTEWTNVTVARPLFKDHHQPHLPADLGYYDLRIEQIQLDQIKLAKQYGISAFCYYYYWFSGKTLMTLPLQRHLDQNLDLDFCLCWANESWSRRWDGSEEDLLIQQRHTFDSDIEFIYSCLQYFHSPRYIKIDGSPFLQVYRISLMERPRETLERWREIVRADGFPDLHICMVESFGLTDPFEYGCDSSSQFPPHGVVGDRINATIAELDPKFSGTIYNYGEIVRGELARPSPPHVRFRGAMPSWDNTARKGTAGNVFAGASPALFETWLRYLTNDARQRLPRGQRFVFVNAWNEWAEGTHLEPDRKFGHANLRAVRNALTNEAQALAALLPRPDGSGDDLAEARQHVERLLIINRELSRLVSQVKFGLRIGEEVHFAAVSQDLLQLKPAHQAMYNIDALNGKAVTRNALTPLSQSQGLGLKGWFYHPSADSDLLITSLRSMNARSEGQRYLAIVHYRDLREDVNTYLGLDNDAIRSGFNLRASLQGVPPGMYEIELICPDESSATSGAIVRTGVAILIG
jgi:hypothetical protein